MTIWSEPRLQPETTRLSEFPASRGESAAAAAGETFEELPIFQADKSFQLDRALTDTDAFEDRVDATVAELYGRPRPESRAPRPQTPIAEARERVKKEGLESTLKLPERDTIPSRALDIMIERARQRRQREQVVSRGPQDWTQTALSAGTSFLVGAVDPLNVASGFIPVFGELRYGKMLADAGFSTARRAGVAAAQGTASGALGVAALQPLDAYSRTLEGQDWHFAHSLQNVLFGAALGGVLMGATRVGGDVLRTRGGRPLYPFDVGELLDDHPAWADLRRSIETQAPASSSVVRDAGARTPLRPDRLGELPTLPDRYPGAPEETPAMPAPAAVAILTPDEGATAIPARDDGAAAILAREIERRVAEENRAAIAEDMSGRLRAAGMPADEIEANAAMVAARYNARAERLGVDPLALYRAEGIDVRRGDFAPIADTRTFEQARPTAPTFYSAVERTVEALPQPKANAAQWLATIRNRAGVKAEELEWLGLEDWLKQQKGAVTKDALLDYIRANRIEVREVEKGFAADTVARAKAFLRERSGEDPEEAYGYANAGDYVEAANAEGANLPTLGREDTRYGSYTLPDGENYRELLLRLPQSDGPLANLRAKKDAAWQAALEKHDGDPRKAENDPAFREVMVEFVQMNRTLEGRDPSNFHSSHWSEGNVVAHVRFNDRTIDGQRTLFVEEVQSDWHQAGRRRGYKGSENAETRALIIERDRLAAEVADLERQAPEVENLAAYELPDGRWIVADQHSLEVLDDAALAQTFQAHPTRSRAELEAGIASNRRHYAANPEWIRRMDRITEINEQLGQPYGDNLVPDAPFKTTWPELVFKRMLRYAAENGYDQVAWAPGKVQAERYDLSKQISEVAFYGSPDNGGSIVAKDLNGAPVIRRRVDNPAQDLPDIIGKEAAEKLLSAKPKASEPASDNWLDLVKDATSRQEVRIISGLDLQVGGEGMAAFYDRELVNVANKLGKKYGARTAQAELGEPGRPTMWQLIDVTDDGNGRVISEHSSKADALKAEREEDGGTEIREVPGSTTVHTLKITASLRDAATSEGFPLFQADRPQLPIAAVLKGDELGLGDDIQRALREAAERFQATGDMRQPIGAETYRAARDAAERYYEQNFRRAGLKVTNEETGIEIGFSRSGRKKTGATASSHLLPLVPAIPDLLRKGQRVEVSGPDADGVVHHTFAAAAELAGARFDVVLVVREMPNGSFHYSLHHEREAAGSRSPSSGRPPGEPLLEQGPSARAAYVAPGDLNIAPAPESINPPTAAVDAPRGAITLGQNRAIVTLFAGADRSTFMHEMGHLWLDELARDAGRANVPQALKDDLGTVLRWLGVDKAEDIGVAQHEQWAQGFEQYLREGRAPSNTLARAFDSFKRWLTDLYRTVTGLGRPITDDIRAVMDRMLATDRELAEIVADLPPRAHEDAMRAAVASMVDGTPVRSAELLAAGAQGDKRLAEALTGLERPGTPADPDAAWRALADAAAPHNDPDVLAAADAAAKLAPPASTRPYEPSAEAPARPIKPPAETPDDAEPAIHVGPKAARGPRARPPETWSLLEFIASRGGLAPGDALIGDVRVSLGRSNKFVPGFGHLIRKGGMPLDRAREAAVEAGYLFDIGDVTGREAKTTISTLLEAIDREMRGDRVYRAGVDPAEIPAERQRMAEENRAALERRIDESLAEFDVDPTSLPDSIYARVVQMMEREGESDPLAAWERAVMEEVQHGSEAGKHERIADDIPGWDVPDDAGAASRAGRAAEGRGQRGPGEPVGAAGERDRAPAGEAARAAVDSERRVAEIYDAEVAAGAIDPEGRAALEETLNRIDQDHAARTALVREGAACLLAGFGALAR